MTAPDDVFKGIDELVVQRDQRKNALEEEPAEGETAEDFSFGAFLFERKRSRTGKDIKDFLKEGHDSFPVWTYWFGSRYFDARTFSFSRSYLCLMEAISVTSA